MSKDPSYAKFKSRPLKFLFKFPVIALFSHWLIQGLFYMDPTERLFKLALDFFLTLLFFGLLSLVWHSLWMLVIAFVFAHTLNLIFNGHIWGLMKHFVVLNTSKVVYDDYLQKLVQRGRAEASIQHLFLCGSLVRDEFSSSSDIDLRVVHKPGVLNGLHACVFVLKERSRAFMRKIALDCYVLDRPISLANLRPDEHLIDLLSPSSIGYHIQ